MSRSKQKKFSDIAERENVLEEGNELYGQLPGTWREIQFGNNNPLIVEIGCGRGEYTVGMGRLFPDKNFIGVDIKGARLWKGSSMALDEGLNNVAFLRVYVEQIAEHFAAGEVDEIWITFPDPRPKDRDIKRRLTSPRFLQLYRQLLKPGGIVHLKTDNQDLFDYTLELLNDMQVKELRLTKDLYQSDLQDHTMGIQTTYEKRYLQEGVRINYLQFRFG